MSVSNSQKQDIRELIIRRVNKALEALQVKHWPEIAKEIAAKQKTAPFKNVEALIKEADEAYEAKQAAEEKYSAIAAKARVAYKEVDPNYYSGGYSRPDMEEYNNLLKKLAVNELLKGNGQYAKGFQAIQSFKENSEEAIILALTTTEIRKFISSVNDLLGLEEDDFLNTLLKKD